MFYLFAFVLRFLCVFSLTMTLRVVRTQGDIYVVVHFRVLNVFHAVDLIFAVVCYAEIESTENVLYHEGLHVICLLILVHVRNSSVTISRLIFLASLRFFPERCIFFISPTRHHPSNFVFIFRGYICMLLEYRCRFKCTVNT